jgi:hypothetical protein
LVHICQRNDHVLAPTTIVSDFESALAGAVSQQWPNALHHGCYFHFTQAVWRKVQEHGITALYNNNDEARNCVRKLLAMAFLPIPIIRNNFQLLSNASPQALQPLFEYFNAQWLTRIPLSRWNVFDADNRTNNHVEGWNRRFNASVRRHHTNIWHFLRCLKDEHSANEMAINQFIAGQIIAGPRNTQYLAIDRRIARLKQRFEDGIINTDVYWQGMAHLVGSKQ